ncbi:MAG: esterase-like activity of phytase family protein [Pirellulaceae bacterium]|nr:esterase-like activity of phytase family protein [Pirellulaceae bacterium]
MKNCFTKCVMAVGMTLLSVVSAHAQETFRRVATFPVFENTDITVQAVASQVAANATGNRLIYTDPIQEKLGFVDITNPSNPIAAGTLAINGSPVALGVIGNIAVVANHLGAEDGNVQLVDLNQSKVVRTIPLSGPPSDVNVNSSGQYAAVAIESTGEILIIDAITPFAVLWPTRVVRLNWEISDPEPTSVSIHSNGRCAATLTNSNQVAILDFSEKRGWRILFNAILPQLVNGAKIERVWDAKTVNLEQVDATRNALVELVETLPNEPRTPAGVTWLSPNTLATANRDSRGFSIFDRQGQVRYDSGNQFEHLAARIGHFPEQRAEFWGAEPNAVAFAKFGGKDYLFASGKAAGMVGVYTMQGDVPTYCQTLATQRSPSGLLAIPSRNLIVVSTDLDNRVGKFRSGISLYELQPGSPDYPTLESANRPDGTPIPWAGISGLSADPFDSNIMYAVYDNRYRNSTILKIDLAFEIPRIVEEIPLINEGAISSLPLGLINVDPEGVAARPQGGFWVATEGNTPPETPEIINDQLLLVAHDGVVEQEILLPASLRAFQIRFGFEGVTCVTDENGYEIVYVCIQRAWQDDPAGFCKIGRYDVANEEWTFARYPLDTPTSPYPGTNWVGLSEITAIDENTLLILERDNQAGADARVKRLYEVDITGVEFRPHGEALPILDKQLWRDILPDMEAPNGAVLEKVEGVAVLPNQDVWIIVDNDGTAIFGETQLFNVGKFSD